MFDHVTIRVADRAASERFYDTVLAALGIQKEHSDDELAEWGDFSLSPAHEDRPVTRGLHIGFRAPSRDEVDEFWRVGTAAGYRDDGPPGPRPEYTEDYYASRTRSPAGSGSPARRAPSQWWRAIPRSTSTWPSRRRTTRPWTPSTGR